MQSRTKSSDATSRFTRTSDQDMLESAYEKCLLYELAKRGFPVESQIVLPLIYDGITIDAGYRIDLRVAKLVIVEVKAIEKCTRFTRRNCCAT